MFSESDQERIVEAIEGAEHTTSGEIVVVVASESSSYLYAPFVWAGGLALLVPWPLVFFTWMPVHWIYAVQLAVYVAAALVLLQRPIRYALVPGSVKRSRAHRRAVEQFLAQNLHTTAGRTGVMVFLSMAERYAEIIADKGIYEQVAPDRWQEIVDALVRRIEDRQPTEALIGAVEAVGALLARHFPPGSHDPDGLPNHLILLD